MKIQLTTEEVEKAIAFYTREKILYSTDFREIENIEVTGEGASIIVSRVDPGNHAPMPCAPVAPARAAY